MPFVGVSLQAQQVYSTFPPNQKAKIQDFTKVSQQLVCQCGCAMVLENCPHVNCSWGIPARRLIEHRIIQGDEVEQIVDGFSAGFGTKVASPEFLKFLTQQQISLVPTVRQGLQDGYGNKVLAKRNPLPYFLLLCAVFFGVAYFILRNWFAKTSPPQTDFLPSSNARAKKSVAAKSSWKKRNTQATSLQRWRNLDK